MSQPTALPPIPRTTLGRTGLETTKLAIGTWGFGPRGSVQATVRDDEDTVEVLRAAFRSGIRYIDTAAAYESEERIGRLLPETDPPDDLLVVTKAGRSGSGGSFTADHFRASVERSLRYLRLERLPLLLIHDPINDDDFRQVMGPGGALEALRRLQSEGLVGHIGMATRAIECLRKAVESDEFDCIQFPRLYTLLNQAAKTTGLLAAAKARNMGTILPAPFGGNILATGAVDGAVYHFRPAIPEVLEAVRLMQARCAELNVSLPGAALAFALTEPLLDATVVGLARPSEVYEDVGACGLPVSRADLESIAAVGRIDPVLLGGPDFVHSTPMAVGAGVADSRPT